MAELSKAPAFEWVDEKGPVKALMYAGEPYRGKPTRVFAYYATPGTLAGDPSLDKNLPGMVLLHGGGGTAYAEWAELWAKRGYAAIAMDFAGSRPIEGQNPHKRENRTRLPDGGPDQGHGEKFDTVKTDDVSDDWPYHAVASAVRAHSLLRTMPGVDADRTGVTGISWGGYLTCIVGSIDHRFKAAVPVYGCGFLHENSTWLKEFEKLGPEHARRWVELYDPSRYLPGCTAAIFFVNGTNDFAYPLDSYMNSYRAVTKADKNICVTVNMPHSHPAGWAPDEIGLWIDQQLKGGTPLPRVSDAKISGREAKAQVDAAVAITKAQLHYALPEGPINKRKWTSVAAKVEGSTVTAEAPPAEADVWFFTVTDERGATVSSEVIIRQ